MSTQTLQQVIDSIGGAAELLGTTKLASECLAETATPEARKGDADA